MTAPSVNSLLTPVPGPKGLFALTAAGTFVTLPAITTSPLDAQGRRKMPGPGHSDAYSIYDPVPWNPLSDAAFGSDHPSTHTHVYTSPMGYGFAIVASADLEQSENLHPCNYFGSTTNTLHPAVKEFLDQWTGGGVMDDSSFALKPRSRQRPYKYLGLLFSKCLAPWPLTATRISPEVR